MASEENTLSNEVAEKSPTKKMVLTNSSPETHEMDTINTSAEEISKSNGEMVAKPPGSSRELTEPKEKVEFKVIFNKQKFDVAFPLSDTVATFKEHVQTLTGVPPAMQKVMYKGLARDDRTLEELGVVPGAKIMVVGSTLNEVLSVSSPSPQETVEDKGATGSTKEPLCRQKAHRKIIEKGVPDDAMPGIKNDKDSLPPFPLSGMLNKTGGKVRLTFKLELDQLWIGTKERTDKIPMSTIKNVVSETIEGHEEYHIVGIQLGPTEASRYWIYWVPAQYVDAIKDAILGKWQFF